MNKNFYKKVTLIILCAFTLIVGAHFARETCEKNKISFAVEEVIEVKNDGTILSTKLWNALYQKSGANKLFTNTFKNVVTLDLSSQNLDDIRGLSIFEMSNLTTLNLSHNNLYTTSTELLKYPKLQILDISKNKLESFEYSQLNEICYQQGLTKLDLSFNEIDSINIKKIEQGNVNLQFNKIADGGIIFPDSLNVELKLSHNLLTEQKAENQKISYGFQGAYNGAKLTGSAKISFYGIDEVSEISIFSGENQLIQKLGIGEKVTLKCGSYIIKFSSENITNFLFSNITFKVVPNLVQIEMFQNNKKIDFSFKLYENTKVVFKSLDEGTVLYSVNGGEWTEGTEFNLNKEGQVILNIKQVVDGIEGETQTLYLNLTINSVLPWIYVLIGIFVFVALYFGVMAFLKWQSKSGKSGKSKKKLD